MGNIFKVFFVLALLAVPLVVLSFLPRLFEIAGGLPANRLQAAAAPSPTPTPRLVDLTPVSARKYAALDDTPPPTLTAPAARAIAFVTPSPAPSGERVVIGNTGGQGAVLRSEPVTGRPVAALREQQVLDVLERRSVSGGGDWVHVRTSDGVEGWVTALVASSTR